MVSLPSIRQMFPEYMDLEPADPSHVKHHASYYPSSPPLPLSTKALPKLEYSGYESSATTTPSDCGSSPRCSPLLSLQRNGDHSIARRTPAATAFIREVRSQYPPTGSYSFDVLRCDPSASTLKHIASTSPADHSDLGRSKSAFILSSPMPNLRGRPTGSLEESQAHHNQPTESDAGSLSDDECISVEDDQSKRHVCPTCSKRFNRPSSLRIHVNTHTGATPYRCPWPSCGRLFNVNSNMRRHYRNHTTSGASGVSLNSVPRRNKGDLDVSPSPPQGVFVRQRSPIIPLQEQYHPQRRV